MIPLIIKVVLFAIIGDNIVPARPLTLVLNVELVAVRLALHNQRGRQAAHATKARSCVATEFISDVDRPGVCLAVSHLCR